MTVYKRENNKATENSAYRLMKKDCIKERISELNREIHDEKIADAKEMQQLLTKIARQEQTEEVVVVENVEKGVSQAKIINKKASNQEAVKAISLLARMQGLEKGGSNVNILIPVLGGEDRLED